MPGQAREELRLNSLITNVSFWPKGAGRYGEENGLGLTFVPPSEPEPCSFPALLPVEELWPVRKPCISYLCPLAYEHLDACSKYGSER